MLTCIRRLFLQQIGMFWVTYNTVHTFKIALVMNLGAWNVPVSKKNVRDYMYTKRGVKCTGLYVVKPHSK